MNPQPTNGFEEGLALRKSKNEPQDVATVAARVRFGDLTISCVSSELWQGLCRLTRHRYEPSRDIGCEKKRLLACTFLKCSDWKRVKTFSDAFGATSAVLSTQFTTADLQLMYHDQLVDLGRRRGRRARTLIGPGRFTIVTGPVGEDARWR